jgi:DJ-1 family protein
MKKVLIPLFTGFEEMEAIVLIDVLRRASIQVDSASLDSSPILASRMTRHLSDIKLSDVKVDEYEMILLPGGIKGTEEMMNSDLLHKIIYEFEKQNLWIGAICAAPNVLRQLLIIDSETEFTCFPSSLDLAEGGVYKDKRIVESGKILTSIGPGSAFEFALFLIEKLVGNEIKNKVEAGLKLP